MILFYGQFDHVCLSCEVICVRIRGLCLDAGGNNRKLVSNIRGTVSIGDFVFLPSRLVKATNIADLSRDIFLWYCLTHLGMVLC